MINIGVIGITFGKDVAQAFNSFDDAQVVAIAARDLDKLQSAAKEIGVSDVYTDWKKMVDREDIDLISIHSPSYLHKEMFEYAVAKQKHILVDKPAGITVEEIQHMIDRAKKYDKHVFVNHEARFNPIVQYMRTHIAEGALGAISAVRVNVYINYYSNPDVAFSWNLNKKQGGGQLLNIGTHAIDLGRYLVGMKKIQTGSVLSSVIPDDMHEAVIDAEAQYAAQYTLDDGITLQLFHNAYCHGFKNLEVQVFGSKGILFYDDREGLRSSYSNDQPLEKIEIEDPLAHIQIGRSLLSKSMKFLAEGYVDLLLGKEVEMHKFCTLEEALENIKWLQR